MLTGAIVKGKIQGLLHIVAGNENWDPSQEEMQQIANLFSDSLNDPDGAVVVTSARRRAPSQNGWDQLRLFTREGISIGIDCIINQTPSGESR